MIHRQLAIAICTSLCKDDDMGKSQLASSPSTPDASPWSFNMADRLDKALRVAGITNADMADALDVSQNTIGNYTSGRTKPSRLQLREWAMRTGAPLTWLETGKVGPTGLDPMTSTVEYGRLATVTPINRAA